METIKLPGPEIEDKMSVERAIARRRSVRRYAPEELTREELSKLLWACQGITEKTRGLRAAPSAGALYPLEVYAATKEGLYKYSPERHLLTKLSSKDLRGELSRASWGQRFVEEAPLDIILCAVYERITGRYGKRGARYVDIEVGHAAQNVHLEAVSLGLASVPVGAFQDEAVSRVLNLPKNEKPVYIIPVGKAR